VREFVRRWAGYCLTGDVSEHKIVFAFGAGANGKSTLLNALAHVLGDYARQAAPDLLMRRRDDPHPTGLADLHGARLVLATETAQGRHLDEALVKRLTGGDRIKARHMFKDFFEFDPTHKLVVATNHRPGIEGTDHGIWRRIRLVPFGVVIPDDQQDRHLDDKLAEPKPPGSSTGRSAAAPPGRHERPHRTHRDHRRHRRLPRRDGRPRRVHQRLLRPHRQRQGRRPQRYGSAGDLSQRKFGLALSERGLRTVVRSDGSGQNRREHMTRTQRTTPVRKGLHLFISPFPQKGPKGKGPHGVFGHHPPPAAANPPAKNSPSKTASASATGKHTRQHPSDAMRDNSRHICVPLPPFTPARPEWDRRCCASGTR
jgi:energy-coupling factor transporter ATP-binding protein EcfA2